jgi:uroporphyrinogen-III synthase
LKIVWITRAEPGASAIAARVRTLGFESLVAPLIEIRPLAADIELGGVAALAFTSAAGVAAFAALMASRELPVFAVGDSTARAAREAGFADVRSADGDVAALACRIVADRSGFDGAVLHAGATSPAGDLTGDLERAAITARYVAVYETALTPPPGHVLARINSIDAVLVHSPSTGRRLAGLLAGAAAPNLSAYCLSPAVAATLEGLKIGRILTTALPNEDALLSLLADYR